MRTAHFLIITLFMFSCLQEDDSALNPDDYDRWEFLTERDGLVNDAVYVIFEDDDENLWFGTSNGLSRYDPEDGDFDNFNVQNALVGNFINAIAQDDNGDLWVGSEGGISILSGNQWLSYPQISGNDWFVNSIEFLDNGEVWVGTANLGIVIISSQGVFQIFDDNCIDCNRIWQVYQDTDGRIWSGSEADIKIFSSSGSLLGQVDIVNDFGASQATTIFEDSQKQIWVGFLEGNTLIRFSGSTIEPIGLNTIFSPWVTGIAELDGDLWFSTFPNGLVRYNGIIMETIYTGPDDDELNTIQVFQDQLWVGTNNDGVARYIP